MLDGRREVWPPHIAAGATSGDPEKLHHLPEANQRRSFHPAWNIGVIVWKLRPEVPGEWAWGL
jgi:hypothetical protein